MDVVPLQTHVQPCVQRCLCGVVLTGLELWQDVHPKRLVNVLPQVGADEVLRTDCPETVTESSVHRAEMFRVGRGIELLYVVFGGHVPKFTDWSGLLADSFRQLVE